MDSEGSIAIFSASNTSCTSPMCCKLLALFLKEMKGDNSLLLFTAAVCKDL